MAKSVSYAHRSLYKNIEPIVKIIILCVYLARVAAREIAILIIMAQILIMVVISRTSNSRISSMGFRVIDINFGFI